MHESIAISGLLVSGVSASVLRAAPSANELTAGYTHEKYCKDYRRSYSGSKLATRKANFDRNLAEVLAHNADKTHTYRKGINQFSDWSDEEFASYNTHKKAMKASSQPSVWNGNGKPVPETKDHRFTTPAVITGVKDQGTCGSCWAHATVQSVESAFAIQFGQLPVLSVGQVNDCSANNNGCGGGSPYGGLSWVGNKTANPVGGLYEEFQYPYMDYYAGGEKKSLTAKCFDLKAAVDAKDTDMGIRMNDKPTATVTKVWMVTMNNATVMAEALNAKGPMAIAIAATRGLQQYESGIWQMDQQDPKAWGLNHAVQIVGYGVDASLKGQSYWVVRNSWAAEWGEAGFIRMWKAGKDQVEPCGVFMSTKVCGTAGLLFMPTFAEVAPAQ